MKKYIILLFIAASAWTCTNNVDDIFDKSSAERMQEAMENIDKTLLAESSGWLFQYWPQSSQRYGGFNMYLKFLPDGEVEVGSEMDASRLVKSLYGMQADYGPTLNFDTYNELLHYFSDPNTNGGGGTGLGYEGDYEFIVESYTADTIRLTGKKSRSSMTLVRFSNTGEASYTDYFNKSNDVLKELFGRFNVTISGQEYSIGIDGIKFGLLNENMQFDSSISFIPTNTGIELYEPLVIAGQTFTKLTLAADGTLTDVKNGLVLQPDIPADYLFSPDYEGSWTMTFSTSATGAFQTKNVTFTATDDLRQPSIQVRGMLANNWSLMLTYNRMDGSLLFERQRVASTTTANQYVCAVPWAASDGGTVYFNEGKAMAAVWDGTTPLNLVMTDLGNFAKEIPAIILWTLNGSWGNVGEYAGGTTNTRRFCNISFLKN